MRVTFRLFGIAIVGVNLLGVPLELRAEDSPASAAKIRQLTRFPSPDEVTNLASGGVDSLVVTGPTYPRVDDIVALKSFKGKVHALISGNAPTVDEAAQANSLTGEVIVYLANASGLIDWIALASLRKDVRVTMATSLLTTEHLNGISKLDRPVEVVLTTANADSFYFIGKLPSNTDVVFSLSGYPNKETQQRINAIDRSVTVYIDTSHESRSDTASWENIIKATHVVKPGKAFGQDVVSTRFLARLGAL